MDAFEINIAGVSNLVEDGTNKVLLDNGLPEEGVGPDTEDALTLKMDDAELIEIRDQWENKSAGYLPRITSKQETNKTYYLGTQKQSFTQGTSPIPSNIIFEAVETFIPQALAKNPEPVVWSDNTPEGKEASEDLKTLLQYQADVLCLRKKLGVMVRHWGIYYIGVLKHGWEQAEDPVTGEDKGDIMTEIRKPQDFILDPDGFINEYGDYVGAFLGERIKCSGKDLAELYPDFEEYVFSKTGGKMGTVCTRTEWWTNEYCFVTFEDQVLDKHKNPFYNYPDRKTSTDEYGMEHEEVLAGQNHFSKPKMPYTFLSVFSLQEHPYDDTNLIEQSISNQNRITERDYQIDRNLRAGNNSILISTNAGNAETAKQIANGIEDGDPILIEGAIGDNVQRLPASALPSGIMQAQEVAKDTLRSVFGVQGVTAQKPNDNTTARGMILSSQMDSTRIGGGIGDALEQVADNVFNWWTQLAYVFYDQKHYAATMGSGRAVNYVGIQMTDEVRRFVVSVTPDSMKPKDEITEMNQAIQLADSGWLDPISLFKRLNDPDPMETAKMVTLFRVSPEQYYQQFFGQAGQTAPGQPQQPQGGATPPQQGDQGTGLSAPTESASLSNVPINTPATPQ